MSRIRNTLVAALGGAMGLAVSSVIWVLTLGDMSRDPAQEDARLEATEISEPAPAHRTSVDPSGASPTSPELRQAKEITALTLLLFSNGDALQLHPAMHE